MDTLALAVGARFRARFGDGVNRLDIPLPSLYAKQTEIKEQARRFNVVDIGRRAGKTYLGDRLAREYLSDGKRVGWFAPSYKYLLEVWQTAAQVLKPFAVKLNATERRIELKNGGVFECWTLDGTDDPGRGRKYHLAIVDEAAIAPNLKNAWEQAIAPTLTDYRGEAWFLSTPKGLNYFHDLYQRGLDELQPDWISWKLPSSVNPFLAPEEIELFRQTLPEQVFAQEYLAEFLQNDGAVFRNVDNACVADEANPSDHADHVVISAVDWGQAHDFTAQSILCCTCKRELALDRFNQIGYKIQRDRILNNCKVWNVGALLVEVNSIGAPNLEELVSDAPNNLRVQGWQMTGQSKPKLIQGMALALEQVAIKWLRHPVGRHELLSYEAKVSTLSNTIKYSAPEGGHDDTVIARCLVRHLSDATFVPEPHILERAEKAWLNPAPPVLAPSDYYRPADKTTVIDLDDAERISRQKSVAMAAFTAELQKLQRRDAARRGDIDHDWE